MAKPERLTADDLRKCKVVEAAHGHGAGMFFYTFRCIEHPRLQRHDHYDRSSRSVASTWRVDGEPVADLDAAAERLNAPPPMTAEELAILAEVSDEFVYMPVGERGKFATRVFSLAQKGLVEWANRSVRRTDAGRRALEEATDAE